MDFQDTHEALTALTKIEDLKFEILEPEEAFHKIVEKNKEPFQFFLCPPRIQLSRNQDAIDREGPHQYQYKKLQHDRNIRILGCSYTDSDDVTFEIDEKPLGELSGKFVAVSYCWGDAQAPPERLPLTSGAYLNVTREVHQLVPYVSSHAAGRPVWIDAVCINQTDEEEKSRQVNMMKDIYAAAECVMVWLGTGNLEIAHQFALFEHLKSPDERLGRGEDIMCGTIFQSRWFERVWVVQELCFARATLFLVGSIALSLPFLKDFLKKRREYHLPSSYYPSDRASRGLPAFNMFEGLCEFREFIQENDGNPVYSLPDTLLSFQGRKASEPRDKVFALLGLAAGHKFQADYGLSVAVTCVRTMISCLYDLDECVLLGYAGLANPRPNNDQSEYATIPTWVPDFTAEFLAPPFTASCPRKLGCRATPPRRHVEEGVKKVEIFEGNRPFNPQMGSMCILDNPSKPPGNHYGLFVLAATVDTIKELSDPGACLNDSVSFQASDSLLQRYETSSHKRFRQFVAFTGCGISRRLFITEKDRLGLGNDGIKIGDLVCLLEGAQVPFIIRGPTAETGASFGKFKKFNLVCDAFVSGVMEGEAYNPNQMEMIMLV